MYKCYYCPDEHHKKGDHNRPCECGKPAHIGYGKCPDAKQA